MVPPNRKSPDLPQKWAIVDNAIVLDSDSLPLREFFRGWNVYEGHKKNVNSLASLMRMSPAEQALDEELRCMPLDQLSQLLEEFVPNSGPVVVPEGLHLPDNWKNLRLERGKNRLRSTDAAGVATAWSKVAVCWGLLANLARSHIP
jgi:hypothetical protein